LKKELDNANAANAQANEDFQKVKQTTEDKLADAQKLANSLKRKLQRALKDTNQTLLDKIKTQKYMLKDLVSRFWQLLQKFFVLGSKLEHGIEKEKNLVNAMDIYLILAEEGDINGIERYWSILQRNLLGEDKFSLALDHFSQLAERNNSNGMINLGYIYSQNDSPVYDLSKAKNLFEKSTFFDNTAAKAMCGLFLILNSVDSIEEQKGFELLRQAAIAGNIRAIPFYGSSILQNSSRSDNPTRAFKYFKKVLILEVQQA
jgi:TPR repeat protein